MMQSRFLVGALCAVLIVCAAAGIAWGPSIWARLHAGQSSTAPEAAATRPQATAGSPGRAQEAAPARSDLTMTPEQILAARCECGLATYQCPKCRYEVGVVKVDPSLLKGDSSRGPVATAPVAKRTFTPAISVTGTVRLNENAAAHISPRIPGIVQTVRVDIGATVRKGDVLLEVDSIELGQALGLYKKSEALTALARKNLEREQSLVDRKIAAQEALIKAQMEFEEHQAELNAAEQKLHVLGLTHEDIAAVNKQTDPCLTGRLAVTAPFAGTVIEKHAVMGELVDASDTVMLLADLSTVWVWADIYGHDLAPLLTRKSEGLVPVQISVLEFPDRTFSGTFDYVGATMDDKTRTVKVRATIDNRDGLLRPGMFCQIRLVLSAPEDLVAVPRDAVVSDEGVDFLFVHLTDDYYVRRAIAKGRESDGYVEIVEGLSPGARIVTQGAFLLKSDVLREKMGQGCAD